MVSIRNKAGANKQADVGPSGPPGITPNLAADECVFLPSFNV